MARASERSRLSAEKAIKEKAAILAKQFTNLHHIFQESLIALRPNNIFKDRTMYDFRPRKSTMRMHTILVGGNAYAVNEKRCHIVGFGKAVLGMAVKLHDDLGSFLAGGVLSVPISSIGEFKALSEPLHHLEVYEGALGNHADETSIMAAKSIEHYVSNLKQDDLLIVLISGGGSALLTMPRSPMSFLEKSKIVHSLHLKAANIKEINIVRIALSDIKGGRLAVAAGDCSMIVTLIVSNIIGDPIDLIAGGPTCKPTFDSQSAIDILKSYQIWDTLSPKTQKLLETPPRKVVMPIRNVAFVVANNELATQAAEQAAKTFGYNAHVLCTKMQGTVENVSKIYVQLMENIIKYRQLPHNKDGKLDGDYPFDITPDFMKKLNTKTKDPLLLIFGGELTNVVHGTGQGGRNQELALCLSLQFYNNDKYKDCVFLAVDTDGHDGPTTASGAFATATVISEFLHQFPTKSLHDAMEYVTRNDSFNFYKNLRSGYYQISTGLTFTNVSDLHLMLIP